MSGLKREMREHLYTALIPFWENMRDDVYGGYYGSMDHRLHVDKKAEKGCILGSRILWFFSNAYACFKEDRLLDDAAHACQFLRGHCIDRKHGGVYWSTDYQGEPYDTTKHTYNQAFAVYALSSYYSVSGDTGALALAREIYTLIEDVCWDGTGYREAFDIAFLPIDNDKLSENGVMAKKTMNTLLHIVEAYTELYRVSGDIKVAEKLRVLLALFTEKVFDPGSGSMNVFFDSSWHSLINLASFGHNIEASWLLDRACEVIGDQQLTGRIQPMTRALAAQVYADAYREHSLLNESENGIVSQSRIWWVQAEGVVGFVNAYEKDPSKAEYLKAARDIWSFIKAAIIDKRPGSEWLWEVDPQVPSPAARPVVNAWKCPYHNGRMCLEILRRTAE